MAKDLAPAVQIAAPACRQAGRRLLAMTILLDILNKIDNIFSGVLDVVEGDLSAVKTGRAKQELVINLPIKVTSYGSTLKLQELASVAVPDFQTLLISPWDKNVIDDIVRSLSTGELGLNPQADGESIRINIPPLTGERRAELIKLVDKKVESGKVLLREERGRIKKEIDDQKGKPDVSEDDIHRAAEELDKKTHEWETKISSAGEDKKQELITL